MANFNPIFGQPSTSISYEIERIERNCGEFQISVRLCQGGACESFKGTSPTAIPYQQDRAFVGTSNTELNDHDLRSACEAAAAIAVDCLDGSTVSVVVLNPIGSLYVANIADSPVMAWTISRTGQVQGHYLILDPHNAQPKIAFDANRVPLEFRNDSSLRNRFYDISISRALGDKLYSLGSTADIHPYEIKKLFDAAGTGGRVFLCIASDGICPPILDGSPCTDDALWVQHYANLIQSRLHETSQPLTADQIADWVIDEAVVRRKAQTEQDNILLQVVEIMPQRTKTLVLAVCDGHRPADYRGSDFTGHCAQMVVEELYRRLIASTVPISDAFPVGSLSLASLSFAKLPQELSANIAGNSPQ